MGYDGGVHPTRAAFIGLYAALRLGAHVDGIRRLRMRGARREPGAMSATDLAARYTEDRAANFDIYLPEWLARNNKAIFGTLFAVNELIVLWRWLARP